MFRHFSAALAVMAIVSVTAPAFAGIQDFTVRNNGKFSVYYIYVSPTTSDQWEDDVLGNQTLPANSQITVEMSGYGNQCMFDIKVVDERNNAREYYDVDLCNILYVDFP
jgi:hypothetical protein